MRCSTPPPGACRSLPALWVGYWLLWPRSSGARTIPTGQQTTLPGPPGVHATRSMTRRHGSSQDGQKLKPTGAEHALDLAWLLLNIAIVAVVLTGSALQL